MNTYAGSRPLLSEVFRLWDEIFDSASFVGGEHVAGFEAEFATACDVQYCVSVNSEPKVSYCV